MKYIKIAMIAAVGLVAAIGCKREEFSSPAPSGDVLSTLTGNWRLAKATQKDEGAEIKNSPYVTMDITSLFPYTDYRLTLTGTTGNKGTYTAVPGNSPKIIKYNTGNWEVDDVTNPKMIWFINGTDTTKMQIGSYPTSFNASFKLKQTKIDVATGKPAITYDYEFVKQ